MFEDFSNTPDPTRLNSLEVALRAREQNQKLAQLVAGYRKANHHNSNTLHRILATLIAGLR